MQDLLEAVRSVSVERRFGRTSGIQGLMVEVAGVQGAVAIGSRVEIERSAGKRTLCEVVGFRSGRAIAMPFDAMDGVGLGAPAWIQSDAASVRPSDTWMGRVVNAMAQPADGSGPLPVGNIAYPLRQQPPAAHMRARLGPKLSTGVRAIDAFTSVCRGQRLGIFSGSGVGKSVMMSMLTRKAECDVAVIGLIGERGREVQEFIQDDLGPEGLARSVIVVSTSDEPALRRRQAAYLTLAIAEYFRDQGAHVLCMIDSLTRFAMAQREIGLASGEPPATKGYTPSVFAELPKLLERAGPGVSGAGAITGLFTVLVEGDDHNEPVADTVRGILDGHLVLERAIAERGRYPAINVLRSLSRSMPGCNTPEEQAVVTEARRVLSTYENMAELIRLGAYKAGTDPELDRAIRLYPMLEAFLSQSRDEASTFVSGYVQLANILAQ